MDKNALDLMCVPTMLLGKKYLRLAKGPTIADNGETDVERNNNVCHLLTRGDWLSIKPLHCKKGGAGSRRGYKVKTIQFIDLQVNG